MTNICRLCLSFSTDNMWPLGDCDGIVYNNISFSMHISLNNALPSEVCTVCLTKLREFKQFYLQVKNNDELLHRELNKSEDALNILYKRIKKENNGTNCELNINENSIEAKGYELKLEEDVDSNYDNFNSEDELPLLSVKDATIEEITDPNYFFINNSEHTDTNGLNDCDWDGVNFKCLTCFETFITQNMLLNHYNNAHKSKEEVIGNAYTIVDADKNKFKCNKCDKCYDNVRAVNKHAKIHGDENFHCKICGRTYKTVSEIIRHGRAHDGTKVSCSFGCGFATVYSGALKSHESRHKKEFKYKCETCGKSFLVKTWYEQHQNVHTGAKPYICHICGLAFHMDRYLKAHCSSVHPDASSTRRYVCVKCSKPCGNMKALTLHLKEHGIMSSVLCDLCGKTLSSTEQLSIHRRTHTGDKPFSCSTCNKSFAKRSNLKLHQLTHSGERAHACGTCGKRYGQRSTLLRHIHKYHKKCQKCDKTFASPIEFAAHQKLCSS